MGMGLGKFYTRHGYGFFSGHIFFRGYEFEQVIPNEFLPIAIVFGFGDRKHCSLVLCR
jgi:hypothetical protein